MLTRKCDICGAEMRMTTPRYKVIFDGWLYTKEKDICIDCFERITDEIRQAEPTISKMEQVDKDINVRSKTEPTPWCKYCQRRWENDCVGVAQCIRDMQMIAELYKASEDEPQTDICDECIFVKGSGWCDNCDGKPKGLDALPKKPTDEPQTDCPWK